MIICTAPSSRSCGTAETHYRDHDSERTGIDARDRLRHLQPQDERLAAAAFYHLNTYTQRKLRECLPFGTRLYYHTLHQWERVVRSRVRR